MNIQNEQIGLKGESLSVYSESGTNSVRWGMAWPKQPITWYKVFIKLGYIKFCYIIFRYFECNENNNVGIQTYFNAPGGSEPLGLDMGTMGKGEMWINGHSIGRHWPGYKAYGTCVRCNYGGTYNEDKCNTNCGQPSQRWYNFRKTFLLSMNTDHDFCMVNYRYHIPRSWLKATGNLLVVFEQWGGDPKGISLAKRTVG